MQLLYQLELGFPNGNGRHRYKLRMVKWMTLAISNRAGGGASQYGNGRHRYKLRLVKCLTLANTKKTAVSQHIAKLSTMTQDAMVYKVSSFVFCFFMVFF